MEAQLLIITGIMSIFIGSIVVIIGNSIYSNENSSEPPEYSFYNRIDDTNGHQPASTDKPPGSEVRIGGIIMLGPIPLILGTDRKSIQTVILLTMILMLMAYLLLR